MIEFLLCDDNKEFVKLLKNKIQKFISKKGIEYKISIFYEYDQDFYKEVKSKNQNKVYFLDIETENSSGIDAARIIREKYEDWNSTIIIVTSHEEYKYTALGNRLDIFDFINKLNNFDKLIEEDLEKLNIKYNKNKKFISVKFNGEISKVYLKDIIYIEKEIDSKNCIIKTFYESKYMKISLIEISKLLNNDFQKISRSMIINKRKIKSYNYKNNELKFIDGSKTDLISRDYKKELKEYVRNNI